MFDLLYLKINGIPYLFKKIGYFFCLGNKNGYVFPLPPAEFRRFARRLLEGGNAGNFCPEYKQVDVMGSLVGHD